ncbi:PREDICTED: A disintegrin and metalloproteinase with thrombospondin motifs 3-like [Nicrophorus vespilloides]|uniref:A disintegrin and metalloproteinase with thrombospondin motifs 3-like n=1 Tax=Nicrophorus vespilloides TaxID=110193 RepID=A0ABM1MFN3_NICVS|nr:PREDICTED: A disintegrin and metalloproteinase with thrombospondin motifs 3-like [Nicrophorus vespilloides]
MCVVHGHVFNSSRSFLMCIHYKSTVVVTMPRFTSLLLVSLLSGHLIRCELYSSISDASRKTGDRCVTEPRFSRAGDVDVIILEGWLLVIDEEHNLLPSGRSLWVSGNDTWSQPVSGCKQKAGYVLGHESSSKVALSVCRELQISGFFMIDGDKYFVEPLNGTHVVFYKKLIRHKRSWEFFNLTGDTIDIGFGPEDSDSDEGSAEDDLEEVDGEDIRRPPLEWKRERMDSEEVGYFFDTAWQPTVLTSRKHHKISVNPQRWLEIAIAVDNSVISFHGKSRVEQYILTLMNIVNAVFQDPSLDANMQLVITRMILYDTNRHSLIRPGNVKKSLENVNSWNRDLHIGLAPGESHHDVAVWLTRSDIGGPSGFAPVSGACDTKRSCALNRDEGLTSAFIIAHELAHILGLSHDGDSKASNNCGDDAFQGSVMAPLVSATFHQFLWSSCSRKEFQRRSRKWTCLSNSPQVNAVVLNKTLQTSFSMDEQCRMEFGEGYSLCRAFDIVEPCSHLWCGHVQSALVCKTKKGPPIEGTECGFNKWCVNGYCESVDRRKFNLDPVQHNPQDGGWGDWGPWGSCSRTCGTGVEFRVRRCDNPAPIYGGSECFGSKEEWRVCNSVSCPEPIQDIRAQQCKRLPKMLKLKPPRSNMTWLPHESDKREMKCKLICASKETGDLYITGENLIDGTPCSYENKSNICIQGTCQPFGCDMKIFSTKMEDACGVCGGDNTECEPKRGVFKRKLKKDVNRVAVLPRLAREIKIEANFTTTSHLTPSVAFILKDRKRNTHTITIPNRSSDNQIIEGTKFYYTKSAGFHLLWAKGPVLAEIVVLVYASRNQVDMGLNISLVSEYYVHRNMSDANIKYKWIIGNWGPCTKTCGGGKRYKTKACSDIFSGKIVPRRFCSISTKPITESQKCNVFSCNFVWYPGMWEPCSAMCGSSGIQMRELYCLPQSMLEEATNGSNKDEPWRFMVKPDKCGDLKPNQQRQCYRRPCPSYWEYGQWSECSSSCGLGISVRESQCTPSINETFYSCDQEPAKQKKFCKAPHNRSTNPLCRTRKPCFGDQSKYCSLPGLVRYCKIPTYKKMCCKSCARRRLTPYIH